ncbi:MAG TPA: nuclear transport factor 2 family protein [Solirubrobacterales bacterium]|nr:nuclear transport factor 2 family protein [Solirubrobacterales bacterium]
MSQENVEVVRDSLNAWIEVDEGLADVQRLSEFLAPGATWDMGTYSGWPGQREFRGMDEFLAFRAAWMEAYDDFSYEVKKILDAGGNRVAATFHQRGKPRGSDSWVEMYYGIVYTIEGGLIQRGQVYATPDEALEAAGLSE